MQLNGNLSVGWHHFPRALQMQTFKEYTLTREWNMSLAQELPFADDTVRMTFIGGPRSCMCVWLYLLNGAGFTHREFIWLLADSSSHNSK